MLHPIAVSACALWGLSLLFLPQWWGSPAFQHLILPLWAWGLVCTLATVLLMTRSLSLVIIGMTLYTLFATIGATAILVHTIGDIGNVSAFGSAVAWACMAAGGMLRLSELR